MIVVVGLLETFSVYLYTQCIVYTLPLFALALTTSFIPMGFVFEVILSCFQSRNNVKGSCGETMEAVTFCLCH